MKNSVRHCFSQAIVFQWKRRGKGWLILVFNGMLEEEKMLFVFVYRGEDFLKQYIFHCHPLHFFLLTWWHISRRGFFQYQAVAAWLLFFRSRQSYRTRQALFWGTYIELSVPFQCQKISFYVNESEKWYQAPGTSGSMEYLWSCQSEKIQRREASNLQTTQKRSKI